MPINAHPDYLNAEAEYLNASTDKEKLLALKKMITLAPKHKGSENLLKQLRTRLKKLKEKKERESKKKGSTKKGIKKEEMQVVLIGKTNSGKSLLLSTLTNIKPKISEIKFSTTQPIVGIMNYKTINIQLIENPAIESENYDKGLTNTADTILILINNLEEIKKIELYLNDSVGKKIIVFNNKDKLNERKISATLSSKKYNFAIIDFEDKTKLEELKNKIFQTFNKIRVYTKESGRTIDITKEKPIILKPDSTVKDAAEKILKGLSKNIVKTKIWGPSSKFSGQIVGIKHKLKDLDIIEIKTK